VELVHKEPVFVDHQKNEAHVERLSLCSGHDRMNSVAEQNNVQVELTFDSTLAESTENLNSQVEGSRIDYFASLPRVCKFKMLK